MEKIPECLSSVGSRVGYTNDLHHSLQFFTPILLVCSSVLCLWNVLHFPTLIVSVACWRKSMVLDQSSPVLHRDIIIAHQCHIRNFYHMVRPLKLIAHASGHTHIIKEHFSSGMIHESYPMDSSVCPWKSPIKKRHANIFLCLLKYFSRCQLVY